MLDPLEHLTRYEYDEADNLAAVQERDGSRTEYRYDHNGNLTEVIDALERHWFREYDGLNRIKSLKDPLDNLAGTRLQSWRDAGSHSFNDDEFEAKSEVLLRERGQAWSGGLER